MKKRNLFVTLCLALALGLGVGAGLSVEQRAERVEAATSTTIYYVVSDSVVGAGNSVRYNLKLGSGSGDKDGWSYAAMSKTGKTYNSEPIYSATFTDSWDGLYVLQFQKMVGETPSNLDVPINYSWTSVGTYNGKMWVHEATEWITYVDDTMTVYDVTMYEVVDGVNKGQIGTDTANAAESYTPDNPAFKANYTFDGWFTNAACTDSYTPVAPTADFDLYAKYTHRNVEDADIIYLVTGYNTSWTGRYIYTYSSTDDGNAAKKGFGAWPGTLYSEAYLGITTAANFGGGSDVYWNGGIMKFACYDSFSCDKVIIHDNNGHEVNLDIVDGAAYFYASDLSDGKYEADTGSAAAVVYAFDEEFGENDPHCSTQPAKAAELYNAWYDATLVDENVASWMESSVVTTSNIHVDVAAAAMKMIVDKANQSGGSFVLHGSNNVRSEMFGNHVIDKSMIAIVIISSLVLVTAFGCFLLKRKEK